MKICVYIFLAVAVGLIQNVRIISMETDKSGVFQKIIYWTFAAVLFLVPLVLWPFSSEVFEFNKIVVTYGLTSIILFAWLSKMVIGKKIIFSRTLLDLPLLLFIGTQTISTFLSIDFYTSLFGYYSRFNGGLISTICYSLLYWAYVSNIGSKETKRLLNVFFGSAVLVCFYAVLEHFGIDKNIWVQDVQSRVFSTLGQPNWLAAWVVALLPLSIALSFERKTKDPYFWAYLLISILLFWTLIFTKSRSGFLAFLTATGVFWLGQIYVHRSKLGFLLKRFFVFNLLFLSICLISGTQWTPSLYAYLNHPETKTVKAEPGTSLETGGTESGIIRKIVWKGAYDVFKNFPVVGTGVETFAYSYYLFRPIEHNITSEWDYIYNKAHNEFLNMAANTGMLGLGSYLLLIVSIVYLLIKTNSENKSINTALLAGFVSLSVSNFFGFSVVPTQLQFFLFPAFAVTYFANHKKERISENTEGWQTMTTFALGAMCVVSLYLISTYWYADILYAEGKAENSATRPDLALPNLAEAYNLQPYQAIYLSEISASYATLAMAYSEDKQSTEAGKYVALAEGSIQKSVNMAPSNINIRRQQFGVLVRLATVDENYLVNARNSLVETIKMAPNDPKLYFNLGVADANLGQSEFALKDFEKSIELKPNYADARLQYAALLTHLKRTTEARTQLTYILERIDPKNEIAKQALENLN